MTDEREEYENEDQAVVNKSHDHFNPVVVTDTLGAAFLGSISIILLGVVAGLLFYIRKLEKMIKDND